jgi:membrane protein implicated in regulation of membrane protease activity
VSARTRYFVLQLPGWTFALAVAWGLHRYTSLSEVVILLGLALYLAKDFALYPLVRSAYEDAPHEPGHGLIGASGRVVVALEPDGWVQVGSERWRARHDPAEPLDRGDSNGRAEPEDAEGHRQSAVDVGVEIRILGLQGHTLLVELDPGDSS